MPSGGLNGSLSSSRPYHSTEVTPPPHKLDETMPLCRQVAASRFGGEGKVGEDS